MRFSGNTSSCPASLLRAGLTNSSKVAAVAAGFPGSPKKGLSSTLPKSKWLARFNGNFPEDFFKIAVLQGRLNMVFFTD